MYISKMSQKILFAFASTVCLGSQVTILYKNVFKLHCTIKSKET